MSIRFILLISLLPHLLTYKCGKSKTPVGCMKGKLAIKGICMNYTLQVVDGKIDTSMIEASWKDPSSGENYAQAFALGNPCDFPSSINEGDEFYFKIKENPDQDCAVCQAYRDKPQKRISITIVPACK